MGYRISWQTRPRISSVLGMPVMDITAADALAGGWTGPLPIAAWSELLTRVKTLQIVEHYNNGVYDEDFDYTADRVVAWPPDYTTTPPPTPSPANETHVTGQFMNLAVNPSEYDAVYTYGPIGYTETAYGQPLFMNMDSWPNSYDAVSIGKKYYEVPDGQVSAIDENGGMWCMIHLGLGSLAVGLGSPIPPGSPTATAYLELSTGAYPIEVLTYEPEPESGLYPFDLSLTITATEWFPYKTSTGADAWDTSTGLPINGGPGA